jgi:hypothetical protein
MAAMTAAPAEALRGDLVPRAAQEGARGRTWGGGARGRVPAEALRGHLVPHDAREGAGGRTWGGGARGRLPAEALRGHLVHAPAAEGSGGRPEGGGAGEEHCLRAGPLQAEALRGHLVHAPAAECSGGRPEGGGAGEEHCPRQLAFQLRPAVGTWYAPVQKVQRAQAAPMPTIELPIAAKESPCFPLSPMWRSWPTRPKGAAARAREEADPLSPSARRSRSIPRASSPREDVMIRKPMIL